MSSSAFLCSYNQVSVSAMNSCSSSLKRSCMKGILLGTVRGFNPLQFHKEKQFNVFPLVWLAPACVPPDMENLFVDMQSTPMLA